jgi:hypothetical protein
LYTNSDTVIDISHIIPKDGPSVSPQSVGVSPPSSAVSSSIQSVATPNTLPRAASVGPSNPSHSSTPKSLKRNSISYVSNNDIKKTNIIKNKEGIDSGEKKEFDLNINSSSKLPPSINDK